MSNPEKVWRRWEVYCPRCNRWHGNTVTGCNNCNRYLLLVERSSLRLRLLRCTGCLIESFSLICPKCQAAIPAKLFDGLDDPPPARKPKEKETDSPKTGCCGCLVWSVVIALVFAYCHHSTPSPRPAALSPSPAPTLSPAPSPAFHSSPSKPTPTKSR